MNEAEREKLLLVLKKHKAEIVSSTDKATHIVHGVPGPVENVEEGMRNFSWRFLCSGHPVVSLVLLCGTCPLVHWMYPELIARVRAQCFESVSRC